MTDRAVSEVVGYALLFGLITLSASALFLAGATSLDGVSEDREIEKGEQTMERLAMNIDDHLEQGVQRRSTPVEADRGSLEFSDADRVEITVVQSETEPSADEFAGREGYTGTIDPIAYAPPGVSSAIESDGADAGSTVVYSNGAVSLDGGVGSEWLREPRLQLGSEASVIPLVETTGKNATPEDVPAVTQIHTEREELHQLRWDGEGRYAVEIRMRTRAERAVLWATYLEERSQNLGCQQSAVERGALRCTGTVDAIYVPILRLDVSLR